MMKRYLAHLTSLTPYAQGRKRQSVKKRDETDDDFDRRTVLEQLHTTLALKLPERCRPDDPDGATERRITIPPMAFHLCLQETASYLGMKIPGGGSKTYTKHFIRGLLFNEPIVLDHRPEDCRIESVWLPLPGGQGSARPRGWKYFAVLDTWDAAVPFIVVDEILKRDVLERHWQLAGSITGIGVWRTINRGLWGKFRLVKLEEVLTPDDEAC
jgi:hypothetical protein